MFYFIGLVSDELSNDKLDEFSTDVQAQFKCNNDTTVKLGKGSTLELKYLRIQAFRSGNSEAFSGDGKCCYVWQKTELSK